MTFIVEQRHLRPGKHFNSPLVEAWRVVGPFSAENTAEALRKAGNATGRALENLRVSGMSSEARK